MTTYRIDVTWDDIREGWPCMPGACPVARAIHRTTGVDILVGTQKFIDSDSPGNPEAAVPAAVRAWVLAFDEDIGVEPFGFDLTLPFSPPDVAT